MRDGYLTPTSRPLARPPALVLALLLALVLLVGVAVAVGAGPRTSPTGDLRHAVASRTARVDATPAPAPRKVPSNTVPLLLAGIVVLALLTPSPRYRYWGPGPSQY